MPTHFTATIESGEKIEVGPRTITWQIKLSTTMICGKSKLLSTQALSVDVQPFSPVTITLYKPGFYPLLPSDQHRWCH